MSLVVSQTGPAGRVGELALWSTAGLVILSLHLGAAYYVMHPNPEPAADSSPPAAIMIELAAEPVAVNTEEEQISPDTMDQEQITENQAEPVEQPPEPIEEPLPEPIEPPPPEPVVEEPPPEPEPEVTETVPEEPVEQIDPLEQQMTAALENVEVPLPTMRPPPPPKEEAKKPEPKKEPVKRVERRKPQPRQAQQEMAEAKAETRQADRTAASQTSAGFFSRQVSPQQWMTRVRTKIARYARKCPGNGKGIVTVRFSFDGSGNVGNVSVARSSGDSAIDNYVVSAVQRASPIPAPPSGSGSSLSQPVACE